MSLVSLVTVAEMNPHGVPLAEGDEVAFLPMAAVNAESLDAVNLETRRFCDVSSNYTPFADGDVLVAKITPCFENGKIAQARLSRPYGFGSSEFHVIRPHGDQLEPRYLLHYLRQDRIRREGERRMTGSAGQRRVPANFLQTLKIPLPPIAEQRRIAAILDNADALRAERRAALAQLDTLTESIFLDMFGDPVANPRGWRDDTKLGDVAHIASGVTKGRRLIGKRTRRVPYLSVANVQDRALRLDEVKMIDATEEEIVRYRLQENDLLLTEGGDPDKLGRGSLWKGERPECIHQNHIFRVRITSPDIEPVFLNWLIGSKRGKRYFLRSAKQTTGIASINMTQLRGFPLLLPPVDRQQLFAQQVAAVTRIQAGQAAGMSYLDALFASLQHRAFRGEL